MQLINQEVIFEFEFSISSFFRYRYSNNFELFTTYLLTQGIFKQLGGI